MKPYDKSMQASDNLIGNYKTQDQLAEEFGISKGTLLRWHRQGIGPPKTKLGPRRVVYRVEDVRRWLTEGTPKDWGRPRKGGE